MNKENNESMNYEISLEVQERINILKVFFMIMVIFIHSYSETIRYTSSNFMLEVPLWFDTFKFVVSKCIARIAVPGFFLISSILLYRKKFDYRKNLLKKFKTLLIPYFILNTFYIVFYFIVQRIPSISSYFASGDNVIAKWNIIDFINAYLGFQNSTPILYPLWFLRDLYVLNMLAIFFEKVVKKFPKISLTIFLIMWLFLKETKLFFLNVEAICFWGIGCYIALKKIDLNIFDKINKYLICGLYIISIVANVITKNLFCNLFVNRIMVLIGLVFFYAVMTNLKNMKLKSILIWLSKYSFSIYLFHEMSLSILRKLLLKILPTTFFFQFIEYLGIPIFIFLECLLISLILEKFFPKLYTTITGNRLGI